MKLNCMLFDLDGTLLDTNRLVLESLKYTIKTVLGRDVDETNLYKYFGIPLTDIMIDLDPDQADTMVKVYREHNLEKHDNLTKPFDGVPETLKALKERSVTTAVVTSKLRSLACRGLDLFDLKGLFDVIIAYEDTNEHKPSAGPALKALELLNIHASGGVVLIGDSPFDICCAQNAGIMSGAVQWSMHPKDALMLLKPDLYLKNFKDLLDYV